MKKKKRTTIIYIIKLFIYIIIISVPAGEVGEGDGVVVRGVSSVGMERALPVDDAAPIVLLVDWARGWGISIHACKMAARIEVPRCARVAPFGRLAQQLQTARGVASHTFAHQVLVRLVIHALHLHRWQLLHFSILML